MHTQLITPIDRKIDISDTEACIHIYMSVHTPSYKNIMIIAETIIQVYRVCHLLLCAEGVTDCCHRVASNDHPVKKVGGVAH